MADSKIRLEFDNASGPEWVATYTFAPPEYDDSFETDSLQDVIFQAKDFTIATRYAEQYLRKKQSEDEKWAQASIVGVELY